MKKFMIWGLALLSTMLFTACSDDNGVAGDAEGNYIALRTIYMRLSPEIPFTPVTNKVQVAIKAENESYVSISLPAATYTNNGQEMHMPSFIIKNVSVLNNSDGDVVILQQRFEQIVEGNKTVVGTIEGEVENDGELDLVVEFKYGNMPFYMIQEFESL